MEDEIKIANCGCGGKAMLYVNPITNRCLLQCESCKIETAFYDTEIETVEAWNRAMGSAEKSSIVERKAKVEYIAEVYRSEIVDHYLSGMCGICGEYAYDHAKYCSDCGAKLDWSRNE